MGCDARAGRVHLVPPRSAVERTLQVDPKGIELILALMSKSMPQGLPVKTEEFYDSRFTNELRDSGFLKRLWGEK